MATTIMREPSNTYRVELWIKPEGVPHVYEAATTYVKAGFYCVYEEVKQCVTKWPIGDVYRTIEEYKPSARRSD